MDNFNYKKYLKNNPLLAEEKRVGKYTWSFMSDDERMDALLSVVKDPDEAVKYIELDWDDLPSRINPQNMRIFKEEEVKEGKRLFHYTIPKNEFGMTRMVIKAKDKEEADEKIAAEYPDGGYEYKGKGSKFKYESINEGSLDSIFGGIPYKTVGTKSFTTTYIPDDVKERIIGRAKEAGKIAQPNVNGGVTVFQTAVSEIELKYRSEDYILDYIANDLFREKYGRTISFNELTDDEQDKVENSYDSYIDEDEPSGFYDKGMGVDE
jgi:hypothetical protein